MQREPESPSRNVTADASGSAYSATRWLKIAPIAATTIGGVTQIGVHIMRLLKLPRRCSKYASPPARMAKIAEMSAIVR